MDLFTTYFTVKYAHTDDTAVKLNQSNNILLKPGELDPRDTLKEIINHYPSINSHWKEVLER